MKFWRSENLITKKGYPTNQNLETNHNLNYPTRNPSPKRFLYKPQHFELTGTLSSQILLPAQLWLYNFVVQLSFIPRVPHQKISQQLSRSNRYRIVSHYIPYIS